MKTEEQGYVYILTNPSFREDWVKIGKSSRPVDIRSKELDNTAVPLPFEIFATIKTCKYNEVEKLVHKTIDRLTDLRIRQNREFFNVSPQMALDIFRDIATTIDDAEVIEYESNVPINPETGKAAPTSPCCNSSDTAVLLLQFWNEFNEQAYKNNDFYQSFNLRKAQPRHSYDFSIGSSAYHVCITVSRQKRLLTAGIYILDDKTLFNTFKKHKDEIESYLNSETEWREASKASRFLVSKSFDIDDKKHWDEAFSWFYDMCLKLKAITHNILNT